MMDAERATSFSNDFKRMNHGAISTVTCCSWKKGKKKEIHQENVPWITLLRFQCGGQSFPQCNGSLLLCKISHSARQAHFSVMLQCCLDSAEEHEGVLTRHPAPAPAPSGHLRMKHHVRAETHVRVEAYSWMQSMIALYCSILGSGLGDLKLRNKFCNHLHVVGITWIRSWGQVHCGF